MNRDYFHFGVNKDIIVLHQKKAALLKALNLFNAKI